MAQIDSWGAELPFLNMAMELFDGELLRQFCFACYGDLLYQNPAHFLRVRKKKINGKFKQSLRLSTAWNKLKTFYWGADNKRRLDKLNKRIRALERRDPRLRHADPKMWLRTFFAPP